MDKRFLQNKITKYTTKYNNLSKIMVGGHKFNVGDNVINSMTEEKGTIIEVKPNNKYIVKNKRRTEYPIQNMNES